MTDLFCGGGGSSTGAIAVPGVEVRIAANHWPLACEVHNLNHQETDHAVVDLHNEDPAYFPRTDLLWASPECFTPADLHEALAMLDDVLFRMFRPHEVAAGMAFPADYRWDAIDPVRRKPPRAADLTKMAGNAVCPPCARDIVGAIAEALR